MRNKKEIESVICTGRHSQKCDYHVTHMTSSQMDPYTQQLHQLDESCLVYYFAISWSTWYPLYSIFLIYMIHHHKESQMDPQAQQALLRSHKLIGSIQKELRIITGSLRNKGRRLGILENPSSQTDVYYAFQTASEIVGQVLWPLSSS